MDNTKKEDIVDSFIKTRTRLKTEDVINRHLHIETAYITRSKGRDGVQDFPVVGFTEFPENYYQGGMRLKQFIFKWSKAAGDNFTIDDFDKFSGDRMLPKFNEILKEQGPFGIILKWKEGKNHRYVDVIFLGG